MATNSPVDGGDELDRGAPGARTTMDRDRIVVWMWGEHDSSTAGALSATITAAVELGDADVVVDLSYVEFMSASTVGLLVHHQALLATRARHLILRSPPRCSRRVLDICGLSELIEVPEAAAVGGSGAQSALETWVEVPTVDGGDRSLAPEPQPPWFYDDHRAATP